MECIALGGLPDGGEIVGTTDGRVLYMPPAIPEHWKRRAEGWQVKRVNPAPLNEVWWMEPTATGVTADQEDHVVNGHVITTAFFPTLKTWVVVGEPRPVPRRHER